MSGLRRLVDEGGSKADLALLHAARADAPPDGEARAKTLAALAAGAAAASAMAGAGKGAAGVLSKGGSVISSALSSTAAKVLMVVVVGGGLGVGGLMAARRSAAPEGARGATAVATTRVMATTSAPAVEMTEGNTRWTTPPTSNANPAPNGASNANPTSNPTSTSTSTSNATPTSNAISNSITNSITTTFVPPPPTTSHALSPRVAPLAPPDTVSVAGGGAVAVAGAAPGHLDSRPLPPVVPPSTVATEVSVLDKARDALAAHDPATAVNVLDRYVRAFPTGTFLPEARVLRIQALLAAGDRSRAQMLADDSLRADPNGPYAKRIREMMAK